MPVDLSRTGIDPDDPSLQPLLADLQGNILKGHGRNYSAFLVVRFQPEAEDAARGWVADFARNSVTTARAQEDQAKAFREGGRKPMGGLFASFFLSAQGYLTLGVPIDQLPSDSQAIFNAGMQARRGALRDPMPDAWQDSLRQPPDALIMLASDDEAEVAREAARLQSELSKVAAAVSVESGSRWLNADGRDVEPFGYADGVSQPLFMKRDLDRAEATNLWGPSAPLELVLTRDPNGAGEDSCGSFVVYRKLEQDVKGLDAAVVALAGSLGVPPDLAGAYAFGRFKDGTPVVLSDRAGGAGGVVNNFTYADDPAGMRCPFHAHTRKINPRGDTHTVLKPGVSFDEERSRRLVRRSVNFGTPEDIGRSPVGLHFLCYQTDLSHQFEFQQVNWANQVNFVRQRTGTDPIIGQGNNLPEGQEWPKQWGGDPSETHRATLAGFVTLKGGEYFFAPSVSFLKGLHASG